VLEYMRDGVVSVAQADACPSVSSLRALKRDFGYYCIELVADQPAEVAQAEMAYVMGGRSDDTGCVASSSMERYDVASGQWSTGAAMDTARSHFGACVIAGEVYVIGGTDANCRPLASAEKYSSLSDTWSAVAPFPETRCCHVTVAVGLDIYMLGGVAAGWGRRADVLKLDSTQGTWSEVESAPEDIIKSAAVAVGTDIYVFGGEDEGGDEDASVYKYDTLASYWTTLAPMPHACAHHSGSVCNGMMYIVGTGVEGEEVLRFDPASAEWSSLETNQRIGRNAPPLCWEDACTWWGDSIIDPV
jgi:hypothetical protein